MINSFENYLKLGKIKKKTPDSEEAKALIIKSSERLEYIKDKKINEKNAKFVLEDAYEAIREASQSLMSIKGFKPYSHEATISFIKEFYKSIFNEEYIYKFDRFRQLRNDSVYKAVEINENDAKSCLVFAHYFVRKAKSLLNNSASISLCMITKNEEKLLEKAIDSVKSIVDEIIIVDTGSKDRTKQIARKFTDKVFDFNFKDDFSEVRNFCMSKASKKWILVLDADETIDKKDLVRIKELVKNKKYLGYRFIQKTKVKDKEYIRGICRLFQNNKGIKFVYPIHETVKNSIKELNGRIGSSGVVIEHLFRYDKDKEKLYFRLLKEKIKKFPNSNALKEYEIEKEIACKKNSFL